jgi:hypothetical protein
LVDGSNLPDSNSNGIPNYREADRVLVDDVVLDVELFNSITINVLENDKIGLLDISTLQIVGTSSIGDSLTVEGEGVWSIEDNGSITFVPDAEFELDPREIRYTLESNNGEDTGVARVMISYLSLVRPDSKTANLREPVIVPVLDNDNGDLNISSVEIILPEGFRDLHPDAELSKDGKELIVPNQGRWKVRTDGTIIYEAEEGSVIVDPTPILYKVFDMRGNELETDALITLYQSVVAGVTTTATDEDCETYSENNIPVFQNLGLWLMLMMGLVSGLFFLRKEFVKHK